MHILSLPKSVPHLFGEFFSVKSFHNFRGRNGRREHFGTVFAVEKLTGTITLTITGTGNIDKKRGRGRRLNCTCVKEDFSILCGVFSLSLTLSFRLAVLRATAVLS